MSQVLSSLEPMALWKQFAAINAIPRGSGKEAQLADYIIGMAKKAGLKGRKDKVGNVLIKKPGTNGLEHYEILALQAHLDMVHQKVDDIPFDFKTQGIEMYVDRDWVKAKGTTLGADNGIGVAAILAILISDTLSHPPIEALFTVSEEESMKGAQGLEKNLLQANVMINLDTEQEGIITVGSAGRVEIIAKGDYKQIPVPTNSKSYFIRVAGLEGGHSGLDIHMGRANAIKILCKVLTSVSSHCKLHLTSFNGGSLLNTIPRKSTAVIAVASKNELKFKKMMDTAISRIKQLFQPTDPELDISYHETTLPNHIMDPENQQNIHQALNWCPDGVYTMSSTLPGLVQTSNNVGKVLIVNGKFEIRCLTRSSDDIEKAALAEAISRRFRAAGGTVKFVGDYAGWDPNPFSAIVWHVKTTYQKLFHFSPKIKAIHAGLECGIIKAKYPAMDIVSFGPTILGAHTPSERVEISSVQRFWKLLTEVLANMPIDPKVDKPKFTLQPFTFTNK